MPKISTKHHFRTGQVMIEDSHPILPSFISIFNHCLMYNIVILCHMYETIVVGGAEKKINHYTEGK